MTTAATALPPTIQEAIAARLLLRLQAHTYGCRRCRTLGSIRNTQAAGYITCPDCEGEGTVFHISKATVTAVMTALTGAKGSDT